MRDHRDGKDPTPVDITALVREHTGKNVLRPLTGRALARNRKAQVNRVAAKGKAAKILRSQR
jgi:hypothetical protein